MIDIHTEAMERTDRYTREAAEKLRYASCYVIAPHEDGPVKIGVATHVPKRHSALQVGCWARLHIYDLLWFAGPPVALRVEAKALASMAVLGRRLRGEWFNESADVAGEHLRLAAEGLGMKWFSESERRLRYSRWNAKQIDALLMVRG